MLHIDIKQEIIAIFIKEINQFLECINNLYNLNVKLSKFNKLQIDFVQNKKKQLKKSCKIFENIKQKCKILHVIPYKKYFLYKNYVIDKNCTVLCKLVNNIETKLDRQDLDELKEYNLYNFKVII